ncbi:hypothetical protein [Aurantiacibacter hainanensis]|uniref:hypothetical protein n=1 Tax=Aurantiacibacter hainanensis TaxID=3076114 RepID=UPI0030C66716
MSADHIAQALTRIESCTDPDVLKMMAKNALRLGEHKVRHAAQLKLYSVLPSAKPGTLEHSVWQCIHALEDALGNERGRTTRLHRTRQKIARDGEHKTVSDLVLGKMSDGFKMLVDRGMPELTFEAVALKYATEFDDAVVEAAEKRLIEAGYDPATLLQ